MQTDEPGCPNANCQGGFELGRTQANNLGNWTLNVAYPNQHSISAYQFKSNTAATPSIYSEFSNCYKCTQPIKSTFSQTICKGQSILFRGKLYNEANPKDSFNVTGDGVSICDSVFVVNIQFQNGIRQMIDVPICFNDTTRIGGKEISKLNPIDSITNLKMSSDAIVLLFLMESKEVYLLTLKQYVPMLVKLLEEQYLTKTILKARLYSKVNPHLAATA
ncbi:MAG: hypothetical protein IPK88_20215 [Saprospiraceae bacterium]|nr:hypothetical protein [Candidatus Defluviibacterium haderslevense]